MQTDRPQIRPANNTRQQDNGATSRLCLGKLSSGRYLHPCIARACQSNFPLTASVFPNSRHEDFHRNDSQAPGPSRTGDLSEAPLGAEMPAQASWCTEVVGCIFDHILPHQRLHRSDIVQTWSLLLSKPSNC